MYIRLDNLQNGPWPHVEPFHAEFVEPPGILRTRGHRTNGEEWRSVSEDASGFLEVRVQIDKNPYSVERFVWWEMYREIFVGVLVVFELGNTALVEKNCGVKSMLKYCMGSLSARRRMRR